MWPSPSKSTARTCSVSCLALLNTPRFQLSIPLPSLMYRRFSSASRAAMTSKSPSPSTSAKATSRIWASGSLGTWVAVTSRKKAVSIPFSAGMVEAHDQAKMPVANQASVFLIVGSMLVQFINASGFSQIFAGRPGERITHIGAGFLGQPKHSRYHAGLLSRYVCGLADVVAEVVKFRCFYFGHLVFNGDTVIAMGLPGLDGPVGVGQVKLPFAHDNGLQLVAIIVDIVGFVRCFCAFRYLHERPDVEPVDVAAGKFRTGNPRDGGQHVDGHGRFGLHLAGWQLARPTHDAGHADAALP